MLLHLIVASGDPAEMALDRFESYIRNAGTLSFSVRSTHPSMPGTSGDGRLVIERPAKLAFDLKWDGGDYRYVIVDGEYLEIEHSSKQYDEYALGQRFAGPPTRIYWPALYAFPDMFGMGSLRPYALGNKYRLTGVETIDGVSTERLEIDIGGEDGTLKAKAWIDAEGRLLKFDYASISIFGRDIKQFEFRDYRAGEPLSERTFHRDVPAGYMLFALPRPPIPIDIGLRVPLTGWADGAGKPIEPAMLTSGQNLLLVVARRECGPSKRLLDALGEQKNQLGELGIRVAVLSEDPVESDFLALRDPDGSKTLELGPPGTPMMYLLNREGRVVWLHFGFAPGAAPGLMKEIAESIQGGNATGE
jgi:hypothetical protein